MPTNNKLKLIGKKKLDISPRRATSKAGALIKASGGASAYLYIAYASDASGTDFTTTFDSALNYIAVKATNTKITVPSASDFSGLWFNYKGQSGSATNTVLYGSAAPTTEGDDDDFYIRTTTNFIYGPKAAGVWPAGIPMNGQDGANAYAYIAYASDDQGTNFTTTFNPALDYQAQIVTTSELSPPIADNFAGKWKYVRGPAGADGQDGTNGADGADGLNGTNGVDGVDGDQGRKAGLIYTWASSTGNADPGSGKFRLSGTTMTPGTALTLRINEADANAVNMDSLISTLSGGDILDFRSNTNTGITFMSFRVVTPPVDVTGYWNIAVTVLAGALPVTNGETIAIQIARQGSRAGLNYQFDAGTTSGDPGSGLWRADTANMAAVATIYLDDEALGAVGMTAFISTWVKNGLILIQTKSNAANQFGILKIVSVTDSGTYYTIAVTALAGTTITDKTECTFLYIPGSNVSWDSATSTLADAAGNDIGIPLVYDLLSDVPAASTMVGKAPIVKALSAAIGALPQAIYAKTAAKWECLGKAVFAHDTPNHRITAPASTFVGTYTFASAASGAQTKITAAGAHGFLTATVINAGDTYIRIKDGSGANWVPGLYKITAITLDTTGTDFTIDHPYNASFGQPVIGLEDAFFVAYRIPMPAFSAAGWLMMVMAYKFTGTAAAKGINVEIVATGGLLGSGYQIWAPADDSSTNNVGGRAEFGFNNISSASVQHRQQVLSDLDGWNTTNAGDAGGGTAGAVATGSGFDILISLKIAAPNDISIVRNYLCEGAI